MVKLPLPLVRFLQVVEDLPPASCSYIVGGHWGLRLSGSTFLLQAGVAVLSQILVSWVGRGDIISRSHRDKVLEVWLDTPPT